MWLLILIMFSGPAQVGNIDVLEHFVRKEKCFERAKSASKYKPVNTSIACMPIKGVRNAAN